MVLDVDGTLTDGKLCIGNEGEVFKAFSVKDGVGINHYLKEAGIIPVIITARESKIVENRCKELGIDQVFQGNQCKEEALSSAINDGDLGYCAFMGDDLPDIPCMKKIKKAGGIVGCPADAVSEVKQISDFVSTQNAGNGAAREFIEFIINGGQPSGNQTYRNDYISHIPSSQQFMEIAKDEYAKERERATSLDNKASAMFTAIIAVLAFVIPDIPFEEFRNVSGTIVENVLFGVGIAILGTGFIFAFVSCWNLIKAFSLKNYRRLNEEDLIDERYLQLMPDESSVVMLKAYKQNTEKNEEFNDDKCEKIEKGMKSGIAGIGLIIAASIFLRIFIGG